jgi:D-alanyl-D-alanine-carboxypeptidase/D-alanyl-D-alanine-endopeptidase
MTGADDVLNHVRSSRSGIAVACLSPEKTDLAFHSGDDPVDAETRFEIGSLTKPMVGTLLAALVVRGDASLETTLGEVVDAGPCSAVTLAQLATQSSGLPRLPPNLSSDRFDPSDPYGHFTAGDVVEGLHVLSTPTPGRYEYSNFGFIVLGHALEVIAGEPAEVLIDRLLLQPLGIDGVTFHGTEGLIPGYAANRRVAHWDNQIIGSGGARATIGEVAQWIGANLRPAATPLEAELRLARGPHFTTDEQILGLAWAHTDGVIWHNGGTGGFRGFSGFAPERGVAIAILANSAELQIVDAVGMRYLKGE